MNLTSCDSCGVVIDKDKLYFSSVPEKDDGTIDERYAAYNQDTGLWEAFVPCPVCNSEIFQ